MVPDRLISEAVGAILTEQVFKGNRHRYVCESYMPMKSCATSTRVEYFTRRRREGMNRGQDRAEITLKVSTISFAGERSTRISSNLIESKLLLRGKKNWGILKNCLTD